MDNPEDFLQKYEEVIRERGRAVLDLAFRFSTGRIISSDLPDSEKIETIEKLDDLHWKLYRDESIPHRVEKKTLAQDQGVSEIHRSNFITEGAIAQ